MKISKDLAITGLKAAFIHSSLAMFKLGDSELDQKLKIGAALFGKALLAGIKALEQYPGEIDINPEKPNTNEIDIEELATRIQQEKK